MFIAETGRKTCRIVDGQVQRDPLRGSRVIDLCADALRMGKQMVV